MLYPIYAARKGESMSTFFQSRACYRRPGEAVINWITRWDEGVKRVEEDPFRQRRGFGRLVFLADVRIVARAQRDGVVYATGREL